MVGATWSLAPLYERQVGMDSGAPSPCVALANDQFEPREMVRAAGAIVIYYGLGNVVGPVLASQFLRWVGPAGLFLSMTIVMAVLLAFVLLRMTLIPALPKRESRYRLYPRTTASAFQLLRTVRSRRRPPAR